jgi:hypothetical protein
MKDRYKFLILAGTFLASYFIPFGSLNVQKALLESFYMIQDYAQKHALFCLVPVFFIAGAETIVLNLQDIRFNACESRMSLMLPTQRFFSPLCRVS